jgi:hypothetical protein
MFAEDFKKKGGLWIMKPTSRCQGQGIFIVDKLAQVAPFRFKVHQQTMPTPPLPSKPPVPRARREEEKAEPGSEDE